MRMPSDENQIRACGIETTFDLKKSLFKSKEFVRGKALAAASPIPERFGYSILTNLLSQAIVIRFSPKPTFIAYCPYLSPALSSPVTIFLRLSSYSSIGPSISRLVAQGTLTYPMFTITLQRDSVDIGGNMGILS